jgi:hypothetical protein
VISSARRPGLLVAVTAVLATLVMGTLAAAPAGAAIGGRASGDRLISVSGRLVVPSEETVDGPVASLDGSVAIEGVVTDNVFVGRGNVRVDGRVDGDVLVLDGDATINGEVTGEVVSVLGRVTVNEGAQVGDDVVSRREPDVADGTVAGDVRDFDLGSVLGGIVIRALIFLWIAVTVSIALLGLAFVLLFPRAAEATVEAGERFWRTLGIGALVGIVGAILAVLVLVTIVGIPLGLGTLSALNVLSALGYVVASLTLGRKMVKGTSTGAWVGAFCAGFGILRVAALLPGIGFIVWVVASLYGLGALTVAAWRAGHGSPVATGDRALTPSSAAPHPE